MAEPGGAAVAIDLGTTGLKVGLVTFDGVVRWTEHAEVPMSLADGGYEQDADGWWQMITAMIGRGLAAGVVDPAAVRVVSCTGQWASTVPVDAAGRPVGPCVMWMDERGGRHAGAAVGGPVAGYSPVALARWVRRTGGVPPPNGKGPLGQHLFLTRDRPEVAAAARWFLEPIDYLTTRFTGRATATQASMMGSFLVDLRRLDRLDYDADLVRWSGVDATKLPPLVPTGSVVGPVRPEVAGALGLPEGVVVTTGQPDLHSAQAGSGAVGPGERHLAISTTSWISCPLDRKKSDLLREIIAMPGATQGTYCVFDNIDTAGICLEWFRRATSFGAPAGEPPPMEAVLAAAATSPPGARGVVFAPWLRGAGAPAVDGRVRAGFHNVTLTTTPGDLARAVLEGVAVQNATLHEAVRRFVGAPLAPLRVVGGGARSDLWCQIHADALGVPIERVADPLYGNLRGAALWSAVALGVVRLDRVRELVPVERTFHPDPAHRERYAAVADAVGRLRRASRRARRTLRP